MSRPWSSLSAPAFSTPTPTLSGHVTDKREPRDSTHENNSGRASPTTTLLYHFWAHGAAKSSGHHELPTKASVSSQRQRIDSDAYLHRSAARFIFVTVTIACFVLVVVVTGKLHRTKALQEARRKFTEPNRHLFEGREDFPLRRLLDKLHVKARSELPSSTAGVNSPLSARDLKGYGQWLTVLLRVLTTAHALLH